MATEQPPSDSGRQDAEGATPGGMPGDFTASGLGGEDDEWVSFVRAQLVRLFPDFHDAEGAPAEQEEAEAESDEPTFRSELLAMRTEIGVLRGIVAELSDTRETQEPETQEPEIQEPEVQEPAPAPVPVELNPTVLGLALAVVRALDASRSGARPDSEVFEHANLHALLAAVPRPSLSTEAAPDSIPGSPPAPAPASPPLPAPHDVHAKLDAHEEIEKAHDVSIAPEVGTRPKARAQTCEADEMCDEELQEVAEMAGEAQPLVS
ncbi:hypothetical protein CspeluHIS016_0301030 [Cutaneotrichosporon spelunceum]|uniref:Uncharacterized protein n=1 Tax=Cutaneotrichosporon spelunceum TaxID=1672016 RepID=A0AAD3TSX7_9TREE|nr:hypothetical protein CspeluHIS016_0301030 [Cutaneotrichosporon spelunceum]